MKITFAIALVALLAACGGAQTTGAEESSAEPTTRTSVEPPDEGPVDPNAIPESWRACSDDEECIGVAMECCSPCTHEAVNRAHAGEGVFVEATRHCVTVDCSESGCGDTEARCEAGQCVVVADPPG